MTRTWLQIDIETRAERLPALEEALARVGAEASWVADAGDEPLYEPEPDAMPLWSRVRLSALLEPDIGEAALREQLDAALLAPERASLRITLIAERDWDAEFLRRLKPICFGERLWICPGESRCPDPAGVPVRLDPGLAFGTGQHHTTAMCLKWLAGQPLADKSVLDFGCGSGVLAIAALALGAAAATAVDIDPQALVATEANALRNGVRDRLQLGEPAGLGSRTFGIVLANIVSGTLIREASRLRRCCGPGTRIALSGILREQEDEVADAYRPWIALERADLSGDWSLLSGTLEADR